MKKKSSSSHGSDKSNECLSSRKDKKFITFDYNNNLACFMGTTSQSLLKPSSRLDRKLKTNPSLVPSSSADKGSPYGPLRIPRKNRGKIASNSKNAFNNSILLLQYQGQDYLKQESKVDSTQRPKDAQLEEQDQVVRAVVNSCMRVITQDTQHSSNPISARFTPHTNTPTSNQLMPSHHTMMHMVPQEYYYYMMKSPAVRNRRAITNQQSKAYVIDLEDVVNDGRTTIMVRNIPNKYTQEMLLELFEKNNKKKFDFFYLPIDYNNNCNVGYAFLNFIHAKFIPDFYREFHQRKWNRFNSVKVCQVCYARIQGTAQLEHHFEHSNVLQQRDRKFRPLIGLKSLGNISSLVQKQKDQHVNNEGESSQK